MTASVKGACDGKQDYLKDWVLSWQYPAYHCIVQGRKKGYVYIITNAHHTVLYVGVTSDLRGRVGKHRDKYYAKSFSARYNVSKLVYYEVFDSIVTAIEREKQLKAGSRKKKENLINSINPGWAELAISI